MAEILERSGYLVKVRVEVPADRVKASYEALLKDLASRVRVPGFRPGKAPLKVVEARLGREALLQDLKERLVEETYPEAVRELGLSPVAARVVEQDLSEGEGFRYVAEVENYPEVRLPDWRSFALEVSPPEVTEEMVEKALEELRQRYAELVPVEREAQEKDHLFVRTEEGAEFPIDLAKALPHVREALLGKKAGDVVMVPVLNDKGEKVREVRTEVLEVKTLKLPELDEEFAKTLEAESLEDLKNRVRESLKRQAERAYEEARERAFLEKLAEGLEVEIPLPCSGRRSATSWSTWPRTSTGRGSAWRPTRGPEGEGGVGEVPGGPAQGGGEAGPHRPRPGEARRGAQPRGLRGGVAGLPPGRGPGLRRCRPGPSPPVRRGGPRPA